MICRTGSCGLKQLSPRARLSSKIVILTSGTLHFEHAPFFLKGAPRGGVQQASRRKTAFGHRLRPVNADTNSALHQEITSPDRGFLVNPSPADSPRFLGSE
jgi:hypothetical protein